MWTDIAIAAFVFIIYTYFGYFALLRLWARWRKRPDVAAFIQPSVTVVIAAFNEEACIGDAIASILASDYPSSLLDVLVVSDASTDRTESIARTFAPQRVCVLAQAERQGQTAGLLRGARAARGDMMIMADASGRFLVDTVRRLAGHFVDARVGAVSGYKRMESTGTAVAKGDGAYTRYDRDLRALESAIGSSWVGCQGGLFAIRKSLFQVRFPLDMAADNAIGYELYKQGYLHRFDPRAIVIEKPPRDLENEFHRKVRVIVLQMHGMFYFRSLFIPWKHPMFVFQNASHKIFRWLVPFALIALWVASWRSPAPVLHLFFWLQNVFYMLAALGLLRGRGRKTAWILSIPAYFTTVNAAGLLAWTQIFKNYTLWKPPERDKLQPLNID